MFAGGDLVRGAYTVVHAIHDGRLAADAIGRFLLRRRGRERGATAPAPQPSAGVATGADGTSDM